LHNSRPQAKSISSTETLSKKLVKGKGKEKKTKNSIYDLPPAGSSTQVPKSAAEEAEASQSQGPLGAPVISTSDPQMLLEEAEDEEDATFQIGEATPDEDSPGAEESREWSDGSKEADGSGGPKLGTTNGEDFQNPWGGSH
jgi:hypothetical protein